LLIARMENHSLAFDFDTLSLGQPKRTFLTFSKESLIFLIDPIHQGSLTLFLEVVMKWAYLKYPNLCLPRANT